MEAFERGAIRCSDAGPGRFGGIDLGLQGRAIRVAVFDLRRKREEHGLSGGDAVGLSLGVPRIRIVEPLFDLRPLRRGEGDLRVGRMMFTTRHSLPKVG